MKRFLILGALLMSVIVLSLAMSAAHAGNPNPGIRPSHSTPYGMSYGKWAAYWWQWVLGIPNATNPILDTTGAYCGVGQSGPVWFLAGNFGGATEREYIGVPTGKALFIPLITWISVVPFEGADEAEARALANFVMDHVTDLYCTVDGVAVQNPYAYRAESPVFAVDAADALMYPPGHYDTAVTDGYWLMLTPLPPGQHTINFGATVDIPDWSFTFSLDVTYHLTVVPGAKG